MSNFGPKHKVIHVWFSTYLEYSYRTYKESLTNVHSNLSYSGGRQINIFHAKWSRNKKDWVLSHLVV